MKYSASAAPIATSPTGSRFETNSDDDDAAGSTKVIAMSLMRVDRQVVRAMGAEVTLRAWIGYPGPERDPEQEPDDEQQDPGDAAMNTTYGIISAMIVPMPASFW